MRCNLSPPPGSQFDPATWLHGIHQASNAKGYVFTENVSWAWGGLLKKSYPCSHVHGHDFFKNPAKSQDTISTESVSFGTGCRPLTERIQFTYCPIGKRILSLWRCYLVLFIISNKTRYHKKNMPTKLFLLLPIGKNSVLFVCKYALRMNILFWLRIFIFHRQNNIIFVPKNTCFA